MHDGSDDDEFLIRGKQGAKSAGCMYIREFGTGGLGVGQQKGVREEEGEKRRGIYILFYIRLYWFFLLLLGFIYTVEVRGRERDKRGKLGGLGGSKEKGGRRGRKRGKGERKRESWTDIYTR